MTAVSRPASYRSRVLALALAPALVTGSGLLATASYAAPYPPPSQPTTSTSASEVQAGQPVTVCAEHYGAHVPVNLSDDDQHVTTMTTDGDGKGCVTVVWRTPSSTAHPTQQPAPGGAADGGHGAKSRSGTVCHTLTDSGPDRSGDTAVTHARVCVEPATTTTGESGGGGRVAGGRTGQGSAARAGGTHGSLLPFTGAEIAAMVIAALALLALGATTLAVARRRSATGA